MRQKGTDYRISIMGMRPAYRDAVRIRNRSLLIHGALLAAFAGTAAWTLWAAWPFFLAASFFGVTGWYFAAELFLAPTPREYYKERKRAGIRKRRALRRARQAAAA